MAINYVIKTKKKSVSRESNGEKYVEVLYGFDFHNQKGSCLEETTHFS